MPSELEDDKINGILVDIDPKRGTMTVECEGDFYVALWTSDVEVELGDPITINMEDVLN